MARMIFACPVSSLLRPVPDTLGSLLATLLLPHALCCLLRSIFRVPSTRAFPEKTVPVPIYIHISSPSSATALWTCPLGPAPSGEHSLASHRSRWEGTSDSFRNQAVLVFLSPSLSAPLSSVQFVLGVAIGVAESELWLARTGCAELRGPFKMGDKQARFFSLSRNHPLQKGSHSENLKALGMQLSPAVHQGRTLSHPGLGLTTAAWLGSTWPAGSVLLSRSDQRIQPPSATASETILGPTPATHLRAKGCKHSSDSPCSSKLAN